MDLIKFDIVVKIAVDYVSMDIECVIVTIYSHFYIHNLHV